LIHRCVPAFGVVCWIASLAAAAPPLPDHAARMKASRELFQKEVRQVLAGRCVKCHGGEKVESEFDLSTREGLLRGGAEGPAVELENAQASRLLSLIEHREEPRMPANAARLPDRQIAAIRQWLELGAAYDRPLVEKDSSPDAWINRRIDPSQQEFWSFRRLSPVALPESAIQGWGRNAIDRFVARSLQQQSLTPSPPADKRTLIRRLYFDLIGLPPSREEVESFVAGDSPQAYEALVDRLLESPHYGERWGRHWLDAVRFAESHGFEQDYDRPHAFHYRDFVIWALNSGMPFDQFIRWQLAGDEWAPDDVQAWKATGFLGAGVFPTQLTEKEFESARYDELDDMIATIGTSMLGLTVGCARCHDHKFDPIPAGDYYRMVANFTSAIRSNLELDLDAESSRRAIAEWERRHAPIAEELRAFEAQQLGPRFEAWLSETRRKLSAGETVPLADAPWIIASAAEAVSNGGAVLSPQADGSLLATGANADFDTYTFMISTKSPSITALRLEALAHESMVKRGPGRAENGNFGLGRIRVEAGPLEGTDSLAPVSIARARATFQQDSGNLSIAASLDDNPRSGWAIDPQFGKDHAAVFEFTQPIQHADGARIRVTLEFTVNNRHNIGRPRLSLTRMPASDVAIDGAAQSQEVVEVAAILAGKEELNDAQRELLLRWYRPSDAEWKQRHDKLAASLATKPVARLTPVMVVTEGRKPIPHHADDRGFPHYYPETHFLKRGDIAQKQGVARAGFLQVLDSRSGDAEESRWRSAPAPDAKSSYRRREFSSWVTDPERGAGGLLARVIVNRLWQHHFGRGIVATPNDFGAQGERPTQPELLEWLAGELLANGWKLKPLHKLIVSSAAYQQAAAARPDCLTVDPENRWVWRHSPRRLEAESIRDAMLAVSGSLDRTLFGPGTLDENHKRRSIYFMIKRSRLIPAMQIFDAPEPLVSIGERPSTTVAPQALMFMNSAMVRTTAREFAQRLIAANNAPGDFPEAWIRDGYLRALARPPAEDELKAGGRFLVEQSERYQSAGQTAPRDAALTDFCQVLLGLNEFIYTE